jgi:hypothetical protein
MFTSEPKILLSRGLVLVSPEHLCSSLGEQRAHIQLLCLLRVRKDLPHSTLETKRGTPHICFGVELESGMRM